MMKPHIIRFPKERSHTLYFLTYAKNFPVVHVDTKIDMTNVLRTRSELLKKNGAKYSYISFIIQAIAKVIKNYPEANSAVKGFIFPKISYYNRISAKFTIDKEINGKRAVLSGLITDADKLPLALIQKKINYYRDFPFDNIEEFQSIRKLQSLPFIIGQYIYRKFISNFQKREQLLGTYSITSFGHRPVEYVHPVIASTLGFGVCAIQNTPAVIEDEIVIRPIMGLTLSFDHRAIDGAMAADILRDVKMELEQYKL
ncbi:2-oxo acid dehydrogenase subunit E2 [Metabacillus fastidiosus]|uniref:2-oxo acid dehydrogenase subunit E2 n=1 Tax=Metabacillus fastidiosus TaxID=1458 RepID=UPI003D291153